MAAKTKIRYRTRPKAKIRRRSKTTIPLLLAAPVAMPMVDWAKQAMGSEGPAMATNNLVASFTGYNNYQKNFDSSRIRKTYTPILIGWLGHKLANAIGINRLLGRAKIPYIRL